MNILPKIPPSSVRPAGSPPPLSATRSPESRLYFVGNGIRQGAPGAKRTLPLFPHESEDARLTGETRSLFRRLLALNLPVVTESVNATAVKTGVDKIA
jgi:hypothetical protein